MGEADSSQPITAEQIRKAVALLKAQQVEIDNRIWIANVNNSRLEASSQYPDWAKELARKWGLRK